MNRRLARALHAIAITAGYGVISHPQVIGSVLPASAVPFLPLGIMILQSVLGDKQQGSNPDGTPAEQPYVPSRKG
jgi:hypothetical protein